MATKKLNQEIFQCNWISIVWENLLRIKGVTLPPALFFRIDVRPFIEEVKEHTPEENWGSRGESEISHFIKYEMEKSFQWLLDNYMRNAFPDNAEKEKTVSPVGLRVLFFFLVFMIKEGSFTESKEELETFFKSNSIRGNFWGGTHFDNVEELFDCAN
jgi:hypothetical protein